MKPTLRQILAALPDHTPLGRPSLLKAALDQPISALRYDSRLAASGTVFFCLVGKTADGHGYAASAYRNGCRIFFVEHPVEVPADALQIQVTDTRAALSDCAAAYYGYPQKQMRLIGLTGTKGKTTTALLIRSLLEAAGIPTGYIGTNGVDYLDFHHPTVNSTPESVEIYRYLRYMLEEGVKVCVLEVSSQALWMGRTRGLSFDTVLFTNLSRDHIGGVEHPDFEHYRDCKRLLFTDYPAKTLIANRDDPHASFMVEGIDTPRLLFGMEPDSAFPADAPHAPIAWQARAPHPASRNHRIGVEFTALRHGIPLDKPCFLPLPGSFNVQNALAALTVACEGFGISPPVALATLEEAVVPGRFETVTHPALPGVSFVIDYAHNGISLASILDALAEYQPKRLICLFGSVGGRTKERRKDLACAAGPRCDLCILTSDNPGREPVMQILSEIAEAFEGTDTPYLTIPDRAEAIRHALGLLQSGDILVLAGKGHETTQVVGGEALPFSERQILLDALEELYPSQA